MMNEIYDIQTRIGMVIDHVIKTGEEYCTNPTVLISVRISKNNSESASFVIKYGLMNYLIPDITSESIRVIDSINNYLIRPKNEASFISIKKEELEKLF